MYAVVLFNVFYFSVGLTLDQIKAWLWQGFLVDLGIAFIVVRTCHCIIVKLKRRWGYEV